MAALYNENDPFAAEWLRNLIAAGELPAGHVDERSIAELTGADLEGIDDVHFFAGVGGWPLALRLAGWTGPVWTGSCPCQPFSSAGKRKGTADERHLWPEMFRLVRECRPPILFGEQVSSGPALGWLDGVFADLEGEGYACWAAIVGAHSVGAPHIRQRLFWLGDADGLGEGAIGSVRDRSGTDGARSVGGWSRVVFSADCDDDGNCPVCGIDYAECGCPGPTQDGYEYTERPDGLYARRMVDSRSEGPQGFARYGDDGHQPGRIGTNAARSTPAPGAWADCRVILCGDGKHRRISAQPGDEPLAYGLPRKLGPSFAGLGTVGVRAARRNRVGRLRGYGNAIVPQLAAEFIRAFMEAGQ